MIFSAFSFSFRCYGSLQPAVRVRFAPSPTGLMHLGGLRTAFLNYLFARKNKGQFILRIEDTDQKRIKLQSAENLSSVLLWAGLTPDEGPGFGGNFGPYVQSQRLDIYHEKSEYLLETGAAYRCFCSEDRLSILRREAQRTHQARGYDNKCRHLHPDEVQELLSKGTKFTVRFKIPEGAVTHNDMVYGSQTHSVFENEGDFVLLKSDGFPTYHLACVVDDALMEISHVLRGVEWLISTPKHVLLHQALGSTPPHFAHLPLLLNSDRTKLSKRQDSSSVEYYKNKGYSPEALLNFLAVAGGGFGRQDGCQSLDLENLVEKFNLQNVNTNSCIVDLRKLDHFNHDHILKRLSGGNSAVGLIKDLRTILKQTYGQRYEAEEKNLPDSYIRKILLCFKDRIHTLNDLIHPDMEYLWASSTSEDVLQRLTTMKIPNSAIERVKDMHAVLDSVQESEFNEERLGPLLREMSNTLNVPYVSLMKTLRVVLTCQKDGPGVAEILAMLGKKRSLQKIVAISDTRNDIKTNTYASH